MMGEVRSPASFLLLLLLAACGGGSATSLRPPSDSESDAWSSLSFEDKHSRMTFTFHPNMSRRLQRFRQTEYPELACVTCHGMDAEDVDYRMPNGLPPLDPAAMPGPDDSEMARFMTDVFMPEADRLMRVGGTTTCFSCHPTAEGRS